MATAKTKVGKTSKSPASLAKKLSMKGAKAAAKPAAKKTVAVKSKTKAAAKAKPEPKIVPKVAKRALNLAAQLAWENLPIEGDIKKARAAQNIKRVKVAEQVVKSLQSKRDAFAQHVENPDPKGEKLIPFREVINQSGEGMNDNRISEGIKMFEQFVKYGDMSVTSLSKMFNGTKIDGKLLHLPYEGAYNVAADLEKARKDESVDTTEVLASELLNAKMTGNWSPLAPSKKSSGDAKKTKFTASGSEKGIAALEKAVAGYKGTDESSVADKVAADLRDLEALRPMITFIKVNGGKVNKKGVLSFLNENFDAKHWELDGVLAPSETPTVEAQDLDNESLEDLAELESERLAHEEDLEADDLTEDGLEGLDDEGQEEQEAEEAEEEDEEELLDEEAEEEDEALEDEELEDLDWLDD